MKLHPELLLSFLSDPVMAAEVILGVRLDDFQAARVRYLWFVPFVVDNSGWSTGKTVCEWIVAVLRAILIPRQVVAVYYPIFQTGKDTFWTYFEQIDTPVLRSQWKAGKNETHAPGCYIKRCKNGSVIQLPAPGFTKDASTQASRRFHFLIVGEYTQAATMGEGVDELIGRNSAPSWNQNHPLWCNHIVLSAHAEPPTHPSHRYVKAVKDAVLGKNTAREAQQNAHITFCYRDWSDKPIDPAQPERTFRSAYRVDSNIMRSRRTLSRSQFRCRLLGISSLDDRGWYPEIILSRILVSSVLPDVGRSGQGDIHTLGFDVAPGSGVKADSSFAVVWRARATHPNAWWTFEARGRFWIVAPVYALMVKGADSQQLSGLIHGLNIRFGCTNIVMDMGGGGEWVYKDLVKPRQLIANEWRNVTPLCSRDEPMQSDKQPIVIPFRRSSELSALWQKHFLQSDDGMIEAAHRNYREAIEGREIAWPQLLENRPRGERLAMSPPQQAAHRDLDTVWKQITFVSEKVDADGKPLLSRRGFRMFTSGNKKKDGAYASLYGFCGMRLALGAGFYDLSDYEDETVAA